MQDFTINTSSVAASEFIKAKLQACGGRTIVSSINGKIYVIHAHINGKSFICDQLPISPPYEYTVFDIVVELLTQKGGKAEKGNGRNYKLGERKCSTSTIVGAIAKYYAGKKEGDSVYDPIFVLAAILDWAGIAHNRRGYLEINDSWAATHLK